MIIPEPQQNIRILQSYDEVEVFLDTIVCAADKNKRNLGFLPPRAYKDCALKNHLWVAIDSDGTYLGHLMFGGKYPTIRITQISVEPDYRKKGIGTLLIQELKKYGEEKNYLSIFARVAADLPENKFWDRLGFKIGGQRPGGKTTSRTINERYFEFSSQSLFSSPKEKTLDDYKVPSPLLSSPREYVLDLNVIFDLLEDNRKGAEDSVKLIEKILDSEAKIRITSEIKNELNRNTPSDKPDPTLELIKKLPTLETAPENKKNALVRELGNIIFPNIKEKGKDAKNCYSDLAHIASCVLHRNCCFITRDKALIQHREKIEMKYGVKICTPSELNDISNFSTPDPERNVTLHSEDRSKTLNINEKYELKAEQFLESEKIPQEEINKILSGGTESNPRKRITAKYDGEIIGIASLEKTELPSATLEIFLHVNENSVYADIFIDNILEMANRSGASGRFLKQVLITFPQQEKAKRTAVKRGFRRHEENIGKLIKVSYQGIVTPDSWATFSEDFHDLSKIRLAKKMPSFQELENTGLILNQPGNRGSIITSLFDFETFISPGFILGKGRNGLIVPIKEEYAKQLIPDIETQINLFPNDREALLCLERAYFRKPARIDIFRQGTPVLFYVSGDHELGKQLIGIGRITFSDKMTVEQAISSLSRQGVLNREDISERSDSHGHIHVFTFDNFIRFENKITFQELKDMNCIDGANLITAQKLGYNKFLQIIEKTF